MNCFSPDKNHSLSSILIHPGACYLFVRVFARTSKCNISQTNIFLNQSSSSFFVYMLCDALPSEQKLGLKFYILSSLHCTSICPIFWHFSNIKNISWVLSFPTTWAPSIPDLSFKNFSTFRSSFQCLCALSLSFISRWHNREAVASVVWERNESSVRHVIYLSLPENLFHKEAPASNSTLIQAYVHICSSI